ncbi:MAG: RNA 2',3'-cyclic phosphodiesterase [Pararhodobacter sp.]
MIRAFLALPLPVAIVHRLTLVQARLPLPRPTDPEGFHVTLAFLDRQPEPVLEDLHVALEGLRLPAPRLRLDGLGTFGGADPDALHARIAPDPALSALSAKVTQAARGVGIAVKARRFVPHVTLGRFRKGESNPEALARAMAAVGEVTSDPWVAPEMILYRSTLRHEGPLYDPLATYPLAL